MNDEHVVDIQVCYMNILIQVARAAGYEALERKHAANKGVIFFCRENTTRADVWMSYDFQDASAKFQTHTRDDQCANATVLYLGGIDEYARTFERALTGNRLEWNEEAETTTRRSDNRRTLQSRATRTKKLTTERG